MSEYVYIVLKRCNILEAKNLSPEYIEGLKVLVDSLDMIVSEELLATFTVKYQMINYLKKLKAFNKIKVVRTRDNDEIKDITDDVINQVKAEIEDDKIEKCPNCKDPLNDECACFRNRCIDCGDPVGNITFSKCDKCF